jgi:hypothetical protein
VGRGPLGAKHRPEWIIAHGPINFMCAPAATVASRSRLLLRSKLFVPAPKSKIQFSTRLKRSDARAAVLIRPSTKTCIAGDGRGRSGVELADQEAFRIDRGEAGVVGEARFQPSVAAQFTAIEISSGRIVRMLRSFTAGDRTNGLMKPRLPPVSRCRQTIERSGAALSFRIFSSFQETLETKHEERS